MNNIGSLYYYKKKYKDAAKLFNDSISIFEEIRKNAPDEAKIDYLASVLTTYQWLVKTYISDSNPTQAINAKEQSSARYLAEKLAERQGIKNIKSININEYQKEMDKDTIVVSFANSNQDRIAVICATRDKVFAIEVDNTDFVNRLYGKYAKDIEDLDKALSLRGITITKKDEDSLSVKEEKNKTKFEMIVNFYRELLQNPNRCQRTASGSSDFEELSQAFYSLLLKPVEQYLKDKKNILIIPDGILAFVPFEVFDDGSGKYLVEKYGIYYSQSLTVSKMLALRKYSTGKQSFLGFGGAVYDEYTYSEDMKQAVKNEKTLFLALKEKRSMRSSYDSLGIGGWSNLPGTLIEVVEIARLMNTSKIVTKDQVEESSLKDMSENGELQKYRAIHFATHGFVVPELPELSALVLSQFKNEIKGEDGYLTMGEILDLNLECEFINLSACETGLGKIAGGEGIVGLTQSFLLAGANGISVSLWSVADESTKDFMVGVYKLVNEKKVGYKEAIIEMKRRFIDDKKWSSPYYWAPFVYYGR